VSGHNALCSPDLAIGDRADNLNGFVRRQVDLHDGTSLPDVGMRRRMIEGVKPHRFRDTFAVSLLLKSVSIEIVSKLLGHSSSLDDGAYGSAGG
jgi:integrase